MCLEIIEDVKEAIPMTVDNTDLNDMIQKCIPEMVSIVICNHVFLFTL